MIYEYSKWLKCIIALHVYTKQKIVVIIKDIWSLKNTKNV